MDEMIYEKNKVDCPSFEADSRDISTVLKAALEYRRRGWSVIPVGRDKKCLLRSWKKYQSQLATENQIRKWWKKWPDANVAIVLGPVSGNLVCRDFDDIRAWCAFEAYYPDLAGELPVVQTSIEGRHVYFSGQADTMTFDDGELRSAGCYVVAPPSVHASGATYTWLQPVNGQVPAVDPRVFARSLLSDTEITEITEITEDNRDHKRHVQGSALDFVCLAPTTLDEAIQLSLPERAGKRHEMTFLLCRALKAMPQYADAAPQDLWDEFCKWWELAEPLTSGEHDRIDAWDDFCEGWRKVQYPLGQSPLSGVVERAINRPAPKILARYQDEKLNLIANICAELQVLAGDDPFFLSARTAGQLAGIDKMTAFRRMRTLERDKVLQVVERGTPGKIGPDRKATRWRHVVDGERMV